MCPSLPCSAAELTGLVDRYGYQLTGKGKWISMTLKKPKVQGGKRGGKKKQQQVVGKQNRGDDTDEDHQDGSDDDEVCHSASTFVQVLIEIFSLGPFKSSRFGEGAEVPKCTHSTVNSERSCSGCGRSSPYYPFATV